MFFNQLSCFFFHFVPHNVFWGIFFIFFKFYFNYNFFQSCYLIFHIQKIAPHSKEQNKEKNHENWLKKKLFKVKKFQKNAQKLNIFSLKIHKDAGILKKRQNLSK